MAAITMPTDPPNNKDRQMVRRIFPNNSIISLSLT
jgi:hypothetical protein